MNIPTLKLRDGNKVPLLAFGTGTAWFKEPEDAGRFDPELVKMTRAALDAGFRHIDCAEMYNNEEEVGVALKESGLRRDELFITTKVADGIRDIPGAIDQSLKKLQLDYVDLYLIHEPWNLHSDAEYQTAWEAMERVKASGKAKSIGVSNFVRSDMESLLRGGTSDPPVVNQLEYHPYIHRENAGVPYIPWMQSKGIQVEAFKGLSALARLPDGPLIEPLKRIAQAHGTSDTAIMLRWFLQQQVVAVTTTTKVDRLHEYLKVLQVELTKEEMDEIFQSGGQFSNASTSLIAMPMMITRSRESSDTSKSIICLG